MAVVRRRGKSWTLDYRLPGIKTRLRQDFRSKAEAEELCSKYNAFKSAGQLGDFARVINAQVALNQVQATMVGKSLRDAIHDYNRTCTSQKSYQSQRNERGDFKGLYDFLHKERDVFYLREITPQHLEEYQGRLLKTVKASTCNRRFNGFKHFFKKCLDWGYLEKSPAASIEKRATSKNPRKQFSDEEVDRIAEKLPEYLAKPYLFLACTGARPGEPMTAKLSDWNKSQRELVVKCGKNRDISRTLTLNDAAHLILESVSKGKSADNYLFQNSRGKALRTQVLTEAVREVVLELGLERGKTPYGLRHTYATKLAKRHVSSAIVQLLMGHSSIKTTENYFNFMARDVRETVDQFGKIFDFRTKKEVNLVSSSVAEGSKVVAAHVTNETEKTV